MTPRFLRHLAIALVVAQTGGVVEADEFHWDGDCPLPTWWQQCGNPLKSNWTDDPNRPGPGDTVILDAGAGQTSLGASIEIERAEVPGGLRVNQGNVLTLTQGTSSIEALHLFGGGVRAQSGVTVELSSQAALAGELFGPGLFLSNGDSDYSGLKLRDDGTIRNLSPGTLDTGRMELEGLFVNRSELTVGPGADIAGSAGRFATSGTLRFQGGGEVSELAPGYLQTDGSLLVESGWIIVRSSRVQLQGGSIDIREDAILELNSGLGGTQDRRFDGLLTIEGLGRLDVRVDMTVAAPLTLQVGSGTREDGKGGLILYKRLDLEDDLTNRGRFRFKNGTLVGNEGKFVNEGHAYTRTGGGGVLQTDVVNRKTFELAGSGLVIEQPAVLHNERHFRILTGNLSGSGKLSNEDLFWLQRSSPDSLTLAGTAFSNQGRVVVDRGHLRFTGEIDQLTETGTLTGGTWKVYIDGKLSFPRTITEIGPGAVVFMAKEGSIPDLRSLERIRGRLSLMDTLDTDSEVTIEGKLRTGAGGKLRTPKRTFVGGASGGAVEVWPSGRVESGEKLTLDENGIGRGYVTVDTMEEVELVFPGDGRAATPETPPTIQAPLVENLGRILPRRRGAVGTLVIEGDYRQGVGGRLEVEVSEMESDLLDVRGDVEIDGRLVVGRISPLPILGMPYTILTTTGSLAGTFDEVMSDDEVRVLYTTTGVQVVFDSLKLDEIFSDGFESGGVTGWSTNTP